MAINQRPVVITGTSGLLGGYLFARWRRSKTRDSVVHGFDRNPIDIPNTHVIDLTDSHSVIRAIDEIRPELIINCAAMTNVDACEEDEVAATAINATAVRTLAGAAQTVGARLLQISTDAVFGDSGTRAYTEHDEPQPINAYGRTKLAGERAARSSEDNLVLRTTIFGWNTMRLKGSFGEWIHATIRDHEPATVFSDVSFSPIYIGLFADLLETAIEYRLSGLFHLAGADGVSKEEFSREMARQMALPDDNLTSGTLSDVSLRARRARNMVLDSTAIAKQCNVAVPGYRTSISAFLADAPRR